MRDIKKPFNGYIRQLWNVWVVSGTKEYTKGGAMKRPALSLVAERVVKAWEAVPEVISEDMVKKSFMKWAATRWTVRKTTTCLLTM